MSETVIPNLENLLFNSIDLYKSERASFYATKLFNKINSYIDFDRVDIFSFDVFDTLLLRNSKHELYRYLEMSEKFQIFLQTKGINNISVWDIYAARLTAFKTCYRTVNPVAKIREGRLQDVLKLILKILNLDSIFFSDLLNIELNYESANLNINPFLQVFLDYPEIKKKKIIFISDMYMSGDSIASLVKNVYPDLTLKKYYSSADFGITKSSGLLYDLVVKDLGVERNSIIHFGDNFRSDVQLAKARGLKAIHLPIPKISIEDRKQNKEQLENKLIANKFDLSLVY